MSDIPKTQWPATYLGRLQAVTAELRVIGTGATVETVASRFADATNVEVEATLVALVLFGRAQKNGDLFSATDEP